MIRCERCGGEVEEGRGFCPHCGKPLAANAQASATQEEAPRAVPMSSFGEKREEKDKSRTVIYAVVAVVALLLVGGLGYLATRPSQRAGEERLEGALRPGSPEFPGADKLVVEFDPDENALIGPTALGPWAVTFKPVVRNFTGRTVNGLEFRIAGVDLKGNVIRERTALNLDEIEPNRVHTPPLSINFPQDNRPADLKLELTGVRFK
ncbi:MAG: hypothetical protein ABW208_10240 [Pyrinomonadaceae bacterium]